MKTIYVTQSIVKNSRLALLALMIVMTSSAMAGDLPAEAQRIWAPTGDVVGTENHATVTFTSMDAYGDLAKTGEDWQLQEDQFGSGLFNWQNIWASGYQMGLRGAATTAGGEGLNGHLDLWGKRPGRFSYELSHRTNDQFSDRTSELRAATFGLPPAPPSLVDTPTLEWKRTDASVAYRFSSAVAVSGGILSVCRDGFKGSLLRGATGNAVPGLKGFDSTTNREAWLGLDYANGTVDAHLVGAFRTQGGDRAVGTDHAYSDDRTSWRTTLGVNWNATPRTRVMGFGSVAKLENKGTETWQTNALTPSGETSSKGGQLGLIQRVGNDMLLRMAANFQSSNTEAATAMGATTLQTVDRDRTRQDYRLNLTHTGFEATRLELGYRLQSSTREQVLNSGGAFTTDQDKTRNALVFKGRHRFSRSVLLKLQAGWSSLERTQTQDWTDPAVQYWMGDYNRDQTDWKLGLQTRPHRQVRLDLGHQAIDRTFENQITSGIETTFKANRGYANLNWTPRGWLTVYGLVSVGIETYEMGDAVAPDAGMGTINYDGTTWRYVPGVVAQVTSTIQAEAMYEGVRFEDTADTDGDLGVLKSDQDRVLVRLSWQAMEKYSVAATYRRHEFAEHRWDNYIGDLYGLSVSGRF